VNPVLCEEDPRLESLLRIAPFGVPPPRERRATGEPAPRVLFGGIYDWYDPILAIDAVTLARETLPELTLTFNMHPNPELTPQGKLAQAIRHAKRLDFVRFEPWVPYDERGEYLDRFALALLTFPPSLETDLSMRTRIYDFLWGNLPVVTSSAPGTDELLERYDAGIVVRSSRAEDYAAAIASLATPRVGTTLGAPATRPSLTLGTTRDGTRRFVEEHQWSTTLAPLLDFVRHPRFDPHKEEFVMRPHVPEQPRTILQRIKRRIGGAS
jgi:glycosyltransferase involved in cell wall biosynthesis